MFEAIATGVVGGMLTVVFGGLIYMMSIEFRRLWG
jgi:hypothetical protein